MTTRTRRPNRLDTEPLTLNQLGAIHRGFLRLGFDTRADRAERLRITADLARCGPIASTKALSMGQAGRVVNALDGCRSARELHAMTRPEPRGIVAAILTRLFG